MREQGYLGPVGQVALVRTCVTCALTVGTLISRAAAISALVCPAPMALDDLEFARAEGGQLPAARSRVSSCAAARRISRRVTAGDRIGSPAATRLIASAIRPAGRP